MTIALYVATDTVGKIELVTRITGETVEHEKCTTGNREYYRLNVHMGHEYARDVQQATEPAKGAAWIVWGETFHRIHRWVHEHDGFRVETDQSTLAIIAKIRNDRVYLRIVEPSPPTPTNDWWEQERRRAIRDHLGPSPAAREIPVYKPNMLGNGVFEWQKIDPWSDAA